MKKMAILFGAVVLMIAGQQSMAQTAEVQGELKVPPSLDQPQRSVDADRDTGLQVEELRYNDRLGEVSVQHGKGGLRDYYDMNKEDEIFQDGGLIERGANRTWHLGGGRKQ